MAEFNVYKDIQDRTGGEIYIGVVGPVRTGKSTFIKKFMDTVVLVNTSRGGLIDTEALLEALRAKKFAGVGLDVYEQETGMVYEDLSDDIISNETVPRLLAFPNVVITSHQGFFTREALQAIAETTLANARAWEQGLPLENVVPQS